MGFRRWSPNSGIVNTVEYGSPWTPILAWEADSTMQAECCTLAMTEVEFVRIALDRHVMEMTRAVGAGLWA